MAIGVSAWFDDALETEIRALWRDVAEAGISDDLHRGPYRPHMTLGVWEHAAIDKVYEALATESRSIAPMAVRLTSVRLFNTPPSVVYLAPDSEHHLRNIHARLHSCLRSCVSDPLPFQTGAGWTPHCTVAWKLADPSKVRAGQRLAELVLPYVGRAIALGIIDTRPRSNSAASR